MEPQFSKLKGRIVEKYGSQRAFARHIGITEQTVTNKIKGKTTFSTPDIKSWSTELSIPVNEIGDYFFALIVSNS